MSAKLCTIVALVLVATAAAASSAMTFQEIEAIHVSQISVGGEGARGCARGVGRVVGRGVGRGVRAVRKPCARARACDSPRRRVGVGHWTPGAL